MTRFVAAWAALVIGVYLVVWRAVALPSPRGPSATELRQALTAMRAGGDVSSVRLPGPLIARVIADGRVIGRWRSDAPTLAAAVAELTPKLHGSNGPLALDAVTARSALPLVALKLPVAAGLAFARGGVAAVAADGHEALLLPDELSATELPSALSLPDVELEIGLASRSVMALLRRTLDATPVRVDRLLTLHVTDGDEANPPLDAASLRAAALAGGRYLATHLDAAGRFDYRYFPDSDETPPDRDLYSLPRHAGAAWLLARLGDRDLADAAERALAWLVEHHPPQTAAIGNTDDTETSLPASALTLVALAELAAHRPLPPRLDDAAAALTAHLLAMQRPDGDFHHVQRGVTADPAPRLLYASGEAAFALAMRRRVAPAAERAQLDPAVERAVAALVGERPFVLTFVFLEDHWTCLAADAAWPALSTVTRRRAVDHCRAFGAFLGRFQHHADALTAARPAVDGAYGFSPLVPPHTTPVGSRAEALAAIARLERAAGRPVDVTEQLHAGIAFLRRGQLRHGRATGGWLFVDDNAGPTPAIDRHIRIDTVQHAASALLDAAALMEAGPPLW